MHDTSVKLKDGREFCAPIWEWRPQDGYFTLVGVEGVIRFSEVVSAVTCEQRTINGPEDRDELERAKKDGWNGQT